MAQRAVILEQHLEFGLLVLPELCEGFEEAGETHSQFQTDTASDSRERLDPSSRLPPSNPDGVWDDEMRRKIRLQQLEDDEEDEGSERREEKEE